MTTELLLMEKGAIDVSGTESDNTHISLKCGGYMSVKESPFDGLTILPSGNIQISGRTFPFKDKDL